jgi:transcriptional regulator with XRE-family HTH domain
MCRIWKRTVSLEQIKELRQTLKQTALKLRRQGMSQKKVSKITGIPQPTISRLEKEEKADITSNTESGIASTPSYDTREKRLQKHEEPNMASNIQVNNTCMFPTCG